MRISEIAEKARIKSLNPYADKDVDDVYLTDMVSDLVTGPKPNSLIITLQTHKSLIAAANLVDAAMVVFVKGKLPADDVVALATKAKIALFSSGDDAWTFARAVADLGFK